MVRREPEEEKKERGHRVTCVLSVEKLDNCPHLRLVNLLTFRLGVLFPRNGNIISGRISCSVEKSYTFTLGNSTPSLGEFAGSKSTAQLLLRNFHGSKIRLTSRTKYHFPIVDRDPDRSRISPIRNPPYFVDSLSFFLLAEGTSQRLPQNPISFLGHSRSPYIYVSNHLSPNHPSVICCSSAAPVDLGSLDLLFFCRPCRSQPILSLAQWTPMSRCIFGATTYEGQGLMCPSQYTRPLDSEVHEQVSRSSVQSEVKPLVFNPQASLVLIYRPCNVACSYPSIIKDYRLIYK
ncbi:uncharacterized protein TNCV_170911 [Trichonephila clavipes]|nr:uncharacterized protein TNCV_170911 [Trichonephila clavipes]